MPTPTEPHWPKVCRDCKKAPPLPMNVVCKPCRPVHLRRAAAVLLLAAESDQPWMAERVNIMDLDDGEIITVEHSKPAKGEYIRVFVPDDLLRPPVPPTLGTVMFIGPKKR